MPRPQKSNTKKRRKPNSATRKNIKKRKGGSNQIPYVVHQIWFGSTVPSWRQHIFDLMRAACKRNGYKYRLWTEADRTHVNFPITYAYQQDCIKIGKETDQNRFAQVADLARLEILYHLGGIYLDSIFLVNDNFFEKIQMMNENDGYTFICANEDPCGFKCSNGRGQKYMSNSFIASIKKHVVLRRLMDTDVLDEIDLSNPHVNKTTGPYYLRSGIDDPDEDLVGLVKYDHIYPFPMSGSEERPAKKNVCLVDEAEEGAVQVGENKYLVANCFSKLPKETLAIYLVGLGGSWSL